MTNQVQSLKAEFKNGDLLVLSLKESTFAGYKPALLWELFYCERISGNHENVSDDEPVHPDPHFFNVHQTEYFPEIAVSAAKSAFNKRLTCSNPRNESDMGFSLNEILTPVTPT